jgi:serine/threonine protein kinase
VSQHVTEQTCSECRAGPSDSRSAAKPATPRPPDPYVSVADTPRGTGAVLAPGTRLERYVIKDQVGAGSVGTVYRAWDELRECELAIKAVDVGPFSPPEVAAQLRREQTIYSRIEDQRHVLKVHDLHFMPHGGTNLLILSMEYADGGDFRKWLRAHRDDVHERQTSGITLFKQVCRGVAAIHDARVVHLDLKPENFLFVGQTLKVADFSLSGFLHGLTATLPSGGTPRLCNGWLGTPLYMSPEHFLAPHIEDLDERADLYSLGVILYELLHPKCRPPFGGNFARLREMHTSAPVPALSGIPEPLISVVNRCLAKDPSDRFQCVEELIESLDRGREAPTAVPAQPVVAGAEAVWERACEFVEHGQLRDAERTCSHLLELEPDHAHARELQAEIQQRYEEASALYEAIERDAANHPLEELTELLTEASELYPDHPAGRLVQVRLTMKARQYRSAMEEGLRQVGRAKWDVALSWFERATRINPGGPDAERSVQMVGDIIEHIRRERQRIDRAAEAGQRQEALTLARALDEYIARLRDRLRERREEGTE